MTGETISNGRGVQALYHNIMQAKLRGYGTVPGNGPNPSVSATDRAVDIDACEVLVDGDRIEVDAQTKDTRTGDGKPRRDVWYIDANGDLLVEEGDPADPLQEQLDRGESEFELYEPHPPDGTGFTGTVVAEAYIPAGASNFDATEFLDLTVVSKVDVDRYDGDKFILGEGDDWRLSYEDDTNTVELTELSTGETFTWESNGDHDIPGDLSVGGDFTFSGSFDPDTITPDVLRVGSEAILPVYAENDNAVASDASVWLNDGSGNDSAGIYYYDGGVVGPLATGAGSSPGSLSGLTIDVTKDWGGYFLTNVGHDGVRVPSSKNITAESFKSGELEGYFANLSDFEVQSSVVKSGRYALRCIPQSAFTSTTNMDALEAFPQRGDKFQLYIYHTGSDNFRFRFGAQSVSNFDLDAYEVYVGPAGGQIKLEERSPESGTVTLDTYNVSIPQNEWLRLSIEWDLDDTLRATLYDASDTELGTTEGTGSLNVSTGGVGFAHNTQNSIYVDDLTITRRTREYATESDAGVVALGGDTVDPAGGVTGGPLETPTNPGRVARTVVPVNDQATQGEEHGIVDQFGDSRAVFVATADGQGGAYAARADYPLGRLARINANLSWEYDALANIPAWEAAGGSSFSFSLIGRPRRLQVTTDGSADTYGGANANVLVTEEALGAFRLTFKDVSFTNNSAQNNLLLGLSDQDAGSNIYTNGNGITYSSFGEDTNDRLTDIQGGSPNWDSFVDVDWSENHDVSIEYDGSEARVLIDGNLQQRRTMNISADFKPVVEIQDDPEDATADTLEVGQVLVEAL